MEAALRSWIYARSAIACSPEVGEAGCIPGICINASDADLADKARSVQSGEFEVFQQEDHDGFERADTGTCDEIAPAQGAHSP